MSTMLDFENTHQRQLAMPAEQLRTTMAAVRVSIQWLGIQKTLTREQKSEAADTFGAESTFLSAGKKLLDTSHPAFKVVTSIKGKIIGLWKAETLPFPEPGVRLIRQDRIDSFNTRMAKRVPLPSGRIAVCRNWCGMIVRCRQRPARNSLKSPQISPKTRITY